ncbi:MAG: helix-turn-helix transcriptional regulator [Clostridia bacterium]
MLAQWTGDLVGKMHNNGIEKRELAFKLKCSPEYVSKILNGKRSPSNAEQRFNSALTEIIEERENK